MKNSSLLSGWSPRLLDMEVELERDLPDHPAAIREVAQAIRKRLALLSDSPRPLGRFLLVGPDEFVHKLATGLARFFYGEEEAVIPLDMANYSEKYHLHRLVGSSGSLVCSSFEGELTGPVWRRPETIVVLRSIDAAHPDVYHLLGYVLSEGSVIDGIGRAVSFRNAIVLMTTMIGYAESIYAEGTQQPDWVAARNGRHHCDVFPGLARQAIAQTFPPELLSNLVDNIILLR